MTEPAAAEPPSEPVQSEPLQPATRPPRDLVEWERWVAGIVGLLATAAGGAGVFLSTNQAGTAVILVLGIIFLLMAVQGTAVRRITRDGGDFADRAGAEERTVDNVQQTLDEQGPEAAQAALSAATAARPDLRGSAAVGALSAQLYEREAIDAVRAAWRNVIRRRYDTETVMNWASTTTETGDARFDAIFGAELVRADREVSDPPKIALDVVYSRAGGRLDASRLGHRILRLNEAGLPYLIVSAAPTTVAGREQWKLYPRPVPRQLVHWEPTSDLSPLEDAIETILGQVAGELPLDL